MEWIHSSSVRTQHGTRMRGSDNEWLSEKREEKKGFEKRKILERRRVCWVRHGHRKGTRGMGMGVWMGREGIVGCLFPLPCVLTNVMLFSVSVPLCGRTSGASHAHILIIPARPSCSLPNIRCRSTSTPTYRTPLTPLSLTLSFEFVPLVALHLIPAHSHQHQHQRQHQHQHPY